MNENVPNINLSNNLMNNNIQESINNLDTKLKSSNLEQENNNMPNQNLEETNVKKEENNRIQEEEKKSVSSAASQVLREKLIYNDKDEKILYELGQNPEKENEANRQNIEGYGYFVES